MRAKPRLRSVPPEKHSRRPPRTLPGEKMERLECEGQLAFEWVERPTAAPARRRTPTR
jgi:hypothetical protein